MTNDNFPNYELAGHGEKWENVPKTHQNNLTILKTTILQPARNLVNINNPKNDISIFITSGYRSAKHNELAGGATASQHMFGKAVDISCAKFTGLEFFEFMIKNFGDKIGGIGLYANESIKGKFIHIDTRPKQAKNIIVTWYYTSAGAYISPTALMHKIANKYNIKLIG